uniref:Peptidase A1 domain-containing protein n=1 Tax=Strongyloides stercoralis TaxID=6248 RepID=A0A0K0E3D9_STRER
MIIQYYLFIFIILSFIFKTNHQILGSSEPLVINNDRKNSQFPELVTADNFPLFPFTDQFNWGIEVNPANKVALSTDVNIPVPGWGNWDMDGTLYTGHINTDTRVGTIVRPVNRLNIKPETFALLGQNPSFREARKNAENVLVGKLPYNYEPLRCKPPYCNPFVSFVGAGSEFEEGDDIFFIGGLDFPVSIGPLGQGVRFPLSGVVEYGTTPVSYMHANAYNPVSPFDFTKIDNIRRKPSKVINNKLNFLKKLFRKK